jgi:hypothetical protein
MTIQGPPPNTYYKSRAYENINLFHPVFLYQNKIQKHQEILVQAGLNARLWSCFSIFIKELCWALKSYVNFWHGD